MRHIGLVPSINMRQLLDTRKPKGWLRAGKTVELRDRDPFPAITALRREVFGSIIVPGSDLVIEERGRY